MLPSILFTGVECSMLPSTLFTGVECLCRALGRERRSVAFGEEAAVHASRLTVGSHLVEGPRHAGRATVLPVGSQWALTRSKGHATRDAAVLPVGLQWALTWSKGRATRDTTVFPVGLQWALTWSKGHATRDATVLPVGVGRVSIWLAPPP
eukprot:1966018-Pyramimonas_sp.AAC.1